MAHRRAFRVLLGLALVTSALAAAGCRGHGQFQYPSVPKKVQTLSLREQYAAAANTPPLPPRDDAAASGETVPLPLPDPTAPAGGSVVENLPPTSQVSSGEFGLTLADARLLALQYNLELQAQSISASIASQRVREESWRFESIFSGAVARRDVDPPPMGSLLSSLPVQQENVTTDLFLSKPLRTGGAVEIGRSTIRFDTFSPSNERDAYAPTLRLSQPLLRDGGVGFNTSPILLAELDEGIAFQAVRLSVIQVAAQVEQAYWLLAAAQTEAGIAKDNLEFARQQVELSTKLADAELVPRADILRAQSDYYVRQDAVIRADTRLRLTVRALKQVIQSPAWPPDSPLVLSATTEPAPVGLSFRRSREDLVQLALQNRPELSQLELEHGRTNVQRQIAKNQALPRVDVAWQARLLGEGDRFSRARGQAFDGDYFDSFLSLEMEQPIFGNQSARSRAVQAQLAINRVRVDIENQRLVVAREVDDALDLMEQNWLRIAAAEQAVQASEATYRAELLAYEEGQRTSDLVLLAATRLTNARSQLNSAVTEYHLAAVDLAVATGTMLGYAGIELTQDGATEP